MKSAAPTLLPLLRTKAQGDILAWIMLHPDVSYSLTDIARKVGVSAATVLREVDRLAEAGLIRERRSGNTRMITPATDTVVYGPLAALMAVTFGPVVVLTELLHDVAGVDAAYIYGSWAARYLDRPGPVPEDIDVLVIGSADPDELEEMADRASARLGREVNVRRVRRSAWDDAVDDPFKRTVLSRPLIPLVEQATS